MEVLLPVDECGEVANGGLTTTTKESGGLVNFELVSTFPLL